MTAIMLGVMWGLVLAICGFKFNDWRYWVILLASAVTLHIGRS